MTTTRLTRRGLVAAAAAMTTAPAAIAATMTDVTVSKSASTAIQGLWAEAEILRGKLEAHRGAIAAAAESGGISGWMRLGGEANEIGEARYARLVAIMKAEPAADSDLAIMAQVTLDDDFRRGAFNWAGEQLARAIVSFQAPAVG